MFNIHIFFLLLLFVSNAHSYDHRGAENCNKIAIDEEANKKWHIKEHKYEFLQIINRTDRKDLSFKEIDFEKPYYYTSGINIKTKDTSYPLCFDFYTRADVVLIEEKDFYDQWAFRTDKHLVFNFHTMVNCGSSCVRSNVFTYSLNKRTLDHTFWGRTISEAHYPSNWFVDNLTLNEAKVYHNYNNYDLYWRGKWY